MAKDPTLINQPLGVQHFSFCEGYKEKQRFSTSDPSCTRWVDETPLYRAAVGGHLDVVRYLVEHGANVKSGLKEYERPYPLYGALQSGNTDVVGWLLDHGADINAVGEPPGPWRSRGSALHLTARGEPKVKMAKFLLDRGASIDAKDEQGRTPLYWAVEWGNVDIVKLLLAYGADTGIRDAQGATPEELACKKEQEGAESSLKGTRSEIVQLLQTPITESSRARLRDEIDETIRKLETASPLDKAVVTVGATPARNTYLEAAKALAGQKDERLPAILDRRLFDFDWSATAEAAELILNFPTDNGRAYAHRWLNLADSAVLPSATNLRYSEAREALTCVRIWAAANLLTGGPKDEETALAALDRLLPPAQELPYCATIHVHRLYHSLASKPGPERHVMSCRLTPIVDNPYAGNELQELLHKEGCDGVITKGRSGR